MRRKDREVKGIEDILSIVKKAKILHLGLFDGVYPYIVPLHYGYEFIDGNLVFFMHSAKEGHKLDLIKENSHVCIELECDVEPVSGGEIPCRYGAAFASVIGRGKAEIVSDASEKIRGLNLLMENQTGRHFEIDDKMVSGVEVIRVVIPAYTAKARPKP
ncbi:pyridoxamine 5'-phosphate oxidase family protein [Selenomonas sp. TAMA-11512]|uniref:pyridoxamine 5'-phosphate oxidase family protein n=1 Tax=Selenomonas sp. TAMA-11512 TaxID=3095337 RepID=UPI00308FEB64|nr:pyridoxamine 5'-phosphate oxidase family protein [Selenomonas sp. TAMA-11512]